MKLKRTFALVAACGLIAAACGGDDGDAEQATETEPPEATVTVDDSDDSPAATDDAPAEEAPTDEPPPTDEPAPTDADTTFVYAVTQVPTSLDPSVREGDASSFFNLERGGQLVLFDRDYVEDTCTAPPTAENLMGEMVESWDYSDDRTVVTFTLRDDAASPRGNVITAEDVAWSFDRHIALNPVANFLFFTASSYAEDPIEVIDDRTFTLSVEEAGSVDVAVLTLSAATMLDRDYVLGNAGSDDEWGEEFLAANDGGFGPWTWTEADFTPGEEVILRANPNYWGPRGNIDTLVLRAIPDASVRAQLLAAGEVDYAVLLSFDQYQQLEESGSGQVVNCGSSRRDALVPNVRDERFADERVRAAISLALDRDVLAQVAYLGYSNPAVAGLTAAYGFDINDTYQNELDRARELLEEAGYPDGFEFTLTYSPARPGPQAEQLAVLIQSQLAAVGLRAELQLIPGSVEFVDAFNEGNYQMILWAENPAVPDPSYSLGLHTTTEAFNNSSGYSNPEIDALAEALRRTAPGEQRDAAMTEVSDLVIADNPLIYLIDRTWVHAFANDVSGYRHVEAFGVHAVHLSKD